MASNVMKAGKMAMSQSGMNRRGPQNPNRQRQPRRMGKAARMFGMVRGMLNKALKGRDKGMA